MADTIVISPFCRARHIKDSQRSHFEGGEEELLNRIYFAIEEGKSLPGYKKGVIKVVVDPTGFFTPVRELKEGDSGKWEFVARQEGEEPRLEMYIEGEKSPAKRVEIILYSHAVLAEENEQSCDADWEAVSINASPYEEEEPIRPFVFMANHFHISGGSHTNMSDHDFVEQLRKSFLYWRNKVSVKA
jgi:hypothetical protein